MTGVRIFIAYIMHGKEDRVLPRIRLLIRKERKEKPTTVSQSPHPHNNILLHRADSSMLR